MAACGGAVGWKLTPDGYEARLLCPFCKAAAIVGVLIWAVVLCRNPRSPPAPRRAMPWYRSLPLKGGMIEAEH